MSHSEVFKISGYGSLSRLGEIKSHFQPEKTLLVTGRNSFAACGAKDIVEKKFSDGEVIVFDDFSVNPKIEDAQRGLELILNKDGGSKIDLILAIGGGSVMDMAKLIKAFLGAPEDVEALARGTKSVMATSVNLVTVPTSASSGSEATHFAVVYIGMDKFSLASPQLLPDGVILDGQLTKSASPTQRAVNGLDALAQAIEGSWAAGSTAQNRAFGMKAIELLISNLPKILQGNDPTQLQHVMDAANLAGQTINISKTTAAHAFSYAFTSLYNVPHGHAVWLTLPELYAIHLGAHKDNVTDPRGKAHLANVMGQISDLLGVEDSSGCAEYLRGYVRDLGLEPDMKKLGPATREQRLFLSSQVNFERMANNPVIIGNEEVRQIFSL